MLAVTCVSCPSRGSSLLLWGPGVTRGRRRSSTCLSSASRSQIVLLPSISLASWSHITLAGACPATGDTGVPVWPAPAPDSLAAVLAHLLISLADVWISCSHFMVGLLPPVTALWALLWAQRFHPACSRRLPLCLSLLPARVSALGVWKTRQPTDELP